MQSLGADEVIDYTKEDFARRLTDKKVDAVVDLIGGDTEVKSYDILKEDGTFAHIRYTLVSWMQRLCKLSKAYIQRKQMECLFFSYSSW